MQPVEKIMPAVKNVGSRKNCPDVCGRSYQTAYHEQPRKTILGVFDAEVICRKQAGMLRVYPEGGLSSFFASGSGNINNTVLVRKFASTRHRIE